MARVWTVGHSTLDIEDFLEILTRHNITAIADVRSSPASKRYPHFNRDELRSSLKRVGITYVFLGEELGGRPKRSRLFKDGVADYEKMALEPSFMSGLKRVVMGSQEFNIALMCSEKNPMHCHRCLLVGRALSHDRVDVLNIVDDRVMSQTEIEGRLLEVQAQQSKDLFLSSDEQIANAYRGWSLKVAYSKKSRKGDI